MRECRFLEGISYLYSTRPICLSSPTLLPALHRTLAPCVFDAIRTLELVYCSNYAAHSVALNRRVFALFTATLGELHKLRHLHVVLPYKCWRDLLPDLRPQGSAWADVEPRLAWLRGLGESVEVVVTMYGRVREAGAVRVEGMVRVKRRLEGGVFVVI